MEKEPIGNTFEGESYTGKTTSIEILGEMEELRNNGIVIVPEYSVIGQLPEFKRETMEDIRQAISRIIDIEKRRTDHTLRQLEKVGNQATVLFDRGPISCIAFEHAAEKVGYRGAALWMAEAFQEQIEANNIIVPAGMIYLTSPERIIESRANTHQIEGHNKILDFLSNRETRKVLNEAFAAFGDYLPEQLFLTLDTGDKDPESVAAEVLQFIKNQPSDVAQSQPDFVDYAEKLMRQ